MAMIGGMFPPTHSPELQAQWFPTPLLPQKRMTALNGLSSNAAIRAGQKLKIVTY